jgi:2-polyprenyl-3-methyl-5-hydroxy-6-metoxy-1,4-benzoquinol methylase
MREAVAEQLLDINRQFYDKFAQPFAASRVHPQPGYMLLLKFLPRPCLQFLDVGCGEGRLGRFLQSQAAVGHYTGIDSSDRLLQEAQRNTEGSFHQCDISRQRWSSGLGTFDAIACLAVLQHIPGRTNRIRLLQEMGALLAPSGRLLVSTWQFVENDRFRRKIRDWSEVGLDQAEVEAGDYLLTWERGGFSLRYVNIINEAEIAALARQANLHLLTSFRSDGKEGNLNLYSVLERRRPGQ